MYFSIVTLGRERKVDKQLRCSDVCSECEVHANNKNVFLHANQF